VFEGSAEPRFAGDDGSADPRAAAALAAFAAARGSEQAALTALAGVRLLIPVVAALAPADEAPEGSSGEGRAGDGRAGAGGGEKASEMVLPTLVGQDGRPAIPVFTGLDALARWRPSARPIPAEAGLVWRAALQDGCAVVVDIAGPVPLAVEGERLGALAAGQPVPPPHQDTDVRDAVARAVVDAAAAAGISPAAVGFALRPGAEDADLLVELALPGGLGQAGAESLAAQIGSAAMAGLGERLRRGIAVALAP
jgi:hypothetical protein